MRWFAAAALIVATAAPIARADDRKDAAGLHFAAAQAAENRGDWKTAIEEYERAYKLAPHPSVLFNMAQNHEKLDHFHQAADLFRDYLRDAPDADDRRAVEQRIEKLRDHPSQVHVTFPPGATLVVDGQARGEIPVQLELPAGAHHFHVERGADYSPDQEIVLEYGDPVEPAFELKASPPVTPSGRLPPTLTIGVGLGIHGGIASAWDSSVALSFSGRVGGTYAINRKLRALVDLGGSIGPSIEDDRVGVNFELGPKERYVLFVPRGGLSLELWRRGRTHLDAFGEAALVVGYHSLSFGMEEVSKQGVHGVGAGGGITLIGSSERAPRQQYYLSAGYFVLPANVGDNTGYRSQGTVDVGGIELAIGYSILLGPLATAPPASVRSAGDWQVRR